MKAITIRQPWASLIAEGVKTIETRAKQHPWRSAIGQTVAIHAGSSTEAHWIKKGGYRGCNGCGDRFWDHLTPPLPLGAIVATARISEVLPITWRGYAEMGRDDKTRCIAYDDERLWFYRDGHRQDVTDQEPLGEFYYGRFALVLDSIEKLREPFPCRGRQGLWTLPDHVAENLVGLAA